MPTRRPYVGGNWKMNTDRTSGSRLARAVIDALARESGADVAIFPPFPYLITVGSILRDRPSAIRLGAQDCWTKPDGAFTGEVSAAMLRDCEVKVVLAGHSERRHVIGEPDELVGQKAQAILEGGLECILCIGETLKEREAGRTDEVNRRQLRAGLADVSREHLHRLTIAYEPVWAIGTGKTATPGDAQDAQAKVRAELAALYDSEVAESIRIMYGGSVKPSNAAELFAQPDIDGGLIGGASLQADDFVAIVRAAASTPRR
ncbi:MAG: triose-phosphate isomerase [Phycisphaerales bacterium]